MGSHDVRNIGFGVRLPARSTMRYELTTDESIALREQVTQFLTTAETGGTYSYAETDVGDRLTMRSFGNPVLHNLIIMRRPAWHDSRSVILAALNGKNVCHVNVGSARIARWGVDADFVIAAVEKYVLPPKTAWFRFKFWVCHVIPSRWLDFKLHRLSRLAMRQYANQDKETVA